MRIRKCGYKTGKCYVKKQEEEGSYVKKQEEEGRTSQRSPVP